MSSRLKKSRKQALYHKASKQRAEWYQKKLEAARERRVACRIGAPAGPQHLWRYCTRCGNCDGTYDWYAEGRFVDMEIGTPLQLATRVFIGKTQPMVQNLLCEICGVITPWNTLNAGEVPPDENSLYDE